MDGTKPLSGIAGDLLRKNHRDHSVSAPSFVHTGDMCAHEVLPRAPMSPHMTGSIPRKGSQHQQVCIPGYTGHVAGKVAENLHGGTFRSENERATSGHNMRRSSSDPSLAMTAPAALSNGFSGFGATGSRKGLSVAPRVPGYMGNVPGKMSETVHGIRFAEASEAAQNLRDRNPHVCCEGWLRRGVWPVDNMATYKYNNKFVAANTQTLFSDAQEQEARESNDRLGRTFGLKPPKVTVYKPGDRYLHTLCVKAGEEKRKDPSKLTPAGQPTHSVQLDGERWRLHNAITIGNGAQRTAY